MVILELIHVSAVGKQSEQRERERERERRRETRHFIDLFISPGVVSFIIAYLMVIRGCPW